MTSLRRGPDRDRALVRRVEPREHSKSRGLAATAWTHDRDESALLDRQVNVIDGLERAEGLRDARDLNEGFGHELRASGQGL